MHTGTQTSAETNPARDMTGGGTCFHDQINGLRELCVGFDDCLTRRDSLKSVRCVRVAVSACAWVCARVRAWVGPVPVPFMGGGGGVRSGKGADTGLGERDF